MEEPPVAKANWGPLHGRLLDLSLPIGEHAPPYPGDPAPELQPWATLESDGYRVTRLTLGSHQGTHLDAPSHFLKGGGSIDSVRLEACAGPALCVHLTAKGPREAIAVADLEPFATALTPGVRLVLHTGWDHRWRTPGYFTDGPYLTESLATWLAAHRLALLGLDLPTPHPRPDADRRIHRRLLGAGTVLLEGLTHLECVPSGAFWICALPLRLSGVDASPVRAIGLIPEPAQEDKGSSTAVDGKPPA